MERRALEWLWPGRIPLGKLTVIAGEPGTGKSTMMTNIAARLSTGAGWPDGASGQCCQKGDTLILSGEDDPEDTIGPRFDVNGADEHRIALLQMIRNPKVQREFELGRDIPRLEQIVKTQRPDTRMVIVDPLSAYLGGTDANDNAQLRGLLAPLAAFAAETRVAVVAITHFRKSDGSALHRIIGSIGLVGAARMAHAVVHDPDDKERSLLLPVKCNIARMPDGAAFRLINPEGSSVACVHWESEPIRRSVDDVLAAGVHMEYTPSATDRAVQWLRDILIDGPTRAKDVLASAENQEFSERTIRNAKKLLGVQSKRLHRDGDIHWLWYMPD